MSSGQGHVREEPILLTLMSQDQPKGKGHHMLNHILTSCIRDWEHIHNAHQLYLAWGSDHARWLLMSGQTSEHWFRGLLAWLANHDVFPRDW